MKNPPRGDSNSTRLSAGRVGKLSVIGVEPAAGVTDRYIRALRFRALTRFYDPLLAVVLREAVWKSKLVDQVSAGPDMRVLDLGCGTGTLTVLLAKSSPQAEVVGLDADPDALERARTKAVRHGVTLRFVHGRADSPPFSARSFDRVVSSLLFHHLTGDDKKRAFRASYDLLDAGGELHVADWGKPHDLLMRLAFLPVQLLDGFATTGDNVRGVLPQMAHEAGFASVEETHRRRTVFGTLAFLVARR